MTATIVSLPGSLKSPEDVSAEPAVIEILELLLADAKSGNLQAVAFAGVRPGGRPTQGWEIGKGPNAATLMASISYLQSRYATSQITDNSDDSYVEPA